MTSSAKKVKSLGCILGVWAHPDDEAFSMAGLMSYARRNGQRVTIVCATKGELGETANENRWPKSSLSSIRQQELLKSLEVSGVQNVKFLGYKDGFLDQEDEILAANKLREIIAEEKPDTVVSFHEDGVTGHEDHKTIHKWTKKALEGSEKIKFLCVVECQESYEKYGYKNDEKFNIYFNTESPKLICKVDADYCIELDATAKADKEMALRAHASQTNQMFEISQDAEMILSSVCECECFLEVK
jgi:LmbE family N-acetylglucosaminyl deacetylase